MSGGIIDMTDDYGQPVISKGRVVNQEAVDELARKEKDRQTAATSATIIVESPHAEERTAPPTKMAEMEKKIEGMESKLDAILNALKK